jgi:hypothetical protein
MRKTGTDWRLRMGRYDLSSKAEKLWSIRSGGASRDRLGAADTLLSERNELYIFNRCEPLRYCTAVLCCAYSPDHGEQCAALHSTHLRCLLELKMPAEWCLPVIQGFVKVCLLAPRRLACSPLGIPSFGLVCSALAARLAALCFVRAITGDLFRGTCCCARPLPFGRTALGR